MYRKEIVYDRATRDYAMFLDKELVGFARTYHEGEVTLDQLVFELIGSQYFAGIGEPNPMPAPEPDDLEIGNDPAPGRCRNCGGAHHIQACREILDALFAPREHKGYEAGRVDGYHEALNDVRSETYSVMLGETTSSAASA